MNTLQTYINCFFNQLEVYEDVSNGHNYKAFMHQAVLGFLENETKKTALSVYEAFFDCYRIKIAGDTNPFIDLLDVLKSYEENAATLIDKQRDHYIHSVNVFVLGLCIYAQNANFRSAFQSKNLDKADYPFSYDTLGEEFFYRWGIASLFHDVGYPVEIIGKQVTKFINFAANVDCKIEIQSHLEFENFEDFNSIVEVIPKREFTRTYFEKYESCVYVDLLKPVDLLAHKLHVSLGVDLKEIKVHLNSYVRTMANLGFIDHGFYSAIIVLKWYGFLIQQCKYKSEYFFYPVLDSASAILLHNYYKNVIMKLPFNKAYLSPNEHPIAYLLILCDELQEWNREAYGLLDKKRVQAGEASIYIDDDHLNVTYLTKAISLPEGFSSEKENLLGSLLDMKAIFKNGYCIGCEVKNKIEDLTKVINKTEIEPRPLVEHLEKLAARIHELYNQKQLELFPEKPLEYPTFSELPDSLKYSNLRQAKKISDKIQYMGWEIRPLASKGKVIEKIRKETVEILAKIEHEDWVKERIASGWILGQTKDSEKKVSPYLIPYEELNDEIKNYDRDTIRNIPDLLKLIGMGLYEK